MPDLVMSKMQSKDNHWHPLNSINMIEDLVKKGVFKRSRVFDTLEQFQTEDKNLIYSALSGLFKYL